ncbi:hypothetical protein Ferp_0675 [Ferroglobus placidus DSM 10642]|uniref:Uncharacterized protein n=1 Tax=Ferroglobus placidus (strain DSM 10642 / AEDII12DO) TaxID=589924 RepID=D3RWI3_FERPA|nr:hypothetical protein [Ferroglobus placidus]ADC64846.1 hypothetical protein Ferp_0675 [Ferroglobus placidus DSM 10642]
MRMHLLLIGLIVFAVALIYSTPSVSVLYGSHKLYNLTGAGNDVDCVSCHPQAADELSQSAYHKTLTCEDCHRNPYMKSVAFDNGSVVTKGSYAHAAYKPRCLDCHSQTSITKADGTVVSVRKADAFGDPGYGSDYSAHKKFVEGSLNYNIFEGENEACISCHTDYKIRFEFIRPLYVEYTIQKDANGNWYVDSSSITYGADNTTLILKPGSGKKHLFIPLNQIKCENCHSDIWATVQTGYNHITTGWKNPPIHDYTRVGTSYSNVTEYCQLSCHNPIVSGSPPAALSETVHAARRLSCYDCHNTAGNNGVFTVYSKPGNIYRNPPWSDRAMGNFDDYAINAPLFIQGNTCVDCKEVRQSTGTWYTPPVTFKSYFEPTTVPPSKI